MIYRHDFKCSIECVDSELVESAGQVIDVLYQTCTLSYFGSAYTALFALSLHFVNFLKRDRLHLLCTFSSFCSAKALSPPTFVCNQKLCFDSISTKRWNKQNTCRPRESDAIPDSMWSQKWQTRLLLHWLERLILNIVSDTIVSLSNNKWETGSVCGRKRTTNFTYHPMQRFQRDTLCLNQSLFRFSWMTIDIYLCHPNQYRKHIILSWQFEHRSAICSGIKFRNWWPEQDKVVERLLRHHVSPPCLHHLGWIYLWNIDMSRHLVHYI